MSEYLAKIAEQIKDYRNDELDIISPEHVERWVSQFNDEHIETILEETHHILDVAYLTEENVDDFLIGLATNKNLTGGNHKDFWEKTIILENQLNGRSQKHMAEKLNNIISNEFDTTTSSETKSDTYVYIDDFLFSGNRLTNDFETWINEQEPDEFTIHFIFVGWYMLGQWQSENKIKEIIKNKGKKIEIHFWSIEKIRFENRLRYKNESDIFWPKKDIIEDDSVESYLESINPDERKIHFREGNSVGKSKVFKTNEGRQVLENELVIAGIKINSFSSTASKVLKPLGYSPFINFGFGAVMTTYRNCPNNCPLAFWWGSPKAKSSHPFSKWYPLLERKVYSE